MCKSPLVDQAKRLLGPGEEIPALVRNTLSFLQERSVWAVISRNEPAASCRDAAQKRQRLGHTGIPLADEMKSFLGELDIKGSNKRWVAIHCRGDRTLDIKSIEEKLGDGTSVRRLEPDEIAELNIAYGLVNPFSMGVNDLGMLQLKNCLHIFDRDLVNRAGLPGTLFTNIGDYRWGIEFNISDLAKVIEPSNTKGLSDTDVWEITEPLDPSSALSSRPHFKRETIGLLCGNPPESGIHLLSEVNRLIRSTLGQSSLGDISLPEVHLHSIPALGLSMELDLRKDDVYHALSNGLISLCHQGAKYIFLADNTTAIFAEELKTLASATNSHFVSMPEVVVGHVRSKQFKQVALAAIPLVAGDNRFSKYLQLFSEADIEVEQLTPRANRILMDIAYRVKQEGPSESALNRLRDLLKQEVSSEVVVIALTELSLLLAEQRKAPRSSRLIIDAMSLYAESIAKIWLSNGTHLETLGLANGLPSADKVHS